MTTLNDPTAAPAVDELLRELLEPESVPLAELVRLRMAKSDRPTFLAAAHSVVERLLALPRVELVWMHRGIGSKLRSFPRSGEGATTEGWLRTLQRYSDRELIAALSLLGVRDGDKRFVVSSHRWTSPSELARPDNKRRGPIGSRWLPELLEQFNFLTDDPADGGAGMSAKDAERALAAIWDVGSAETIKRNLSRGRTSAVHRRETPT